LVAMDQANRGALAVIELCKLLIFLAPFLGRLGWEFQAETGSKRGVSQGK
jgi:uncharacterized membrane protein YjgN (DUF898 family)